MRNAGQAELNRRALRLLRWCGSPGGRSGERWLEAIGSELAGRNVGGPGKRKARPVLIRKCRSGLVSIADKPCAVETRCDRSVKRGSVCLFLLWRCKDTAFRTEMLLKIP